MTCLLNLESNEIIERKWEDYSNWFLIWSESWLTLAEVGTILATESIAIKENLIAVDNSTMNDLTIVVNLGILIWLSEQDTGLVMVEDDFVMETYFNGKRVGRIYKLIYLTILTQKTRMTVRQAMICNYLVSGNDDTKATDGCIEYVLEYYDILYDIMDKTEEPVYESSRRDPNPESK
jgi:hypothetical protein